MTTSGNGLSVVRRATEADINACKRLADASRDAFGFLTYGVFAEAVARGRLLVSEDSAENLIGFARYNHRVRGPETALYDICVSVSSRRQGVGRALIEHLAAESLEMGRRSIVLKCPQTLPANQFYAALEFELVGTEDGRKRRLNVWRLHVTAP